MDNQLIISSIIKQLSGSTNRLKQMVGAYGLVCGEHKSKPYFGFRFKLCNYANYCQINYHYGKDCYSVEFWKIKGDKGRKVKVFDEVYCDKLTTTFQNYTGLFLNYHPIFG